MKINFRSKVYHDVYYQMRKKIILSTTVIIAISIFLCIIVAATLIHYDVIALDWLKESGILLGFAICIVSGGIGTVLAIIAGKFILKPVDELLSGMEKLANGEYETRLNFGKRSALVGLSEGFNQLATELGNVEILRNDFINNFSHELKTPLVSLTGLVKLLKEENISPDKRKEYLEIIGEETNRLALITSNILTLSKLENQLILPDIKKVNISEQIRTSIILLEKKWDAKMISFDLKFDDYYLYGNEEMLKEVWINLIDNAIKFSKENSTIDIDITKEKKQCVIKITNYGKEIDEKEIDKIFNKFYQIKNDSVGNGIGLSIVSRIIELHHGSVCVNSNDNKTTFSVTLLDDFR